MATYRYYRVNDSTTAEPRLLIRQKDTGAVSRYVGGGDWVADGAMMRWLGPGGDAHDGEVSEADLPAVMKVIDKDWGKGDDA